MSQSPTPSQTAGAGDVSNSGAPIPPEATVAAQNEKLGDGTKESTNGNGTGHVGALNEQFTSLTTVVESLTKAVEGLKQQPQSPDKKIAFWTAYKKLADEFDAELQAKYGQDLDTSLIFAGLFSAVSSAFIIQIQPELQPDPNALTQALLAVLAQNITGLPSAQFLPGAPMPQVTESTTVVIAQSLLYFSLFATLLAALLAVLGKQWLLHYNSVGERGTIAERGIERQRKFDGMRRWRFDLVMQVFPLLLQFSLLLFAAALSIYLQTIHRALAAIAFSLTALGSFLYAVMVISAVVSPDSPFQTSLSFLLKNILHRFPLLKHFEELIKGTWEWLHPTLHQARTILSQCWTTCTGAITPLLPLFHISKPPDPVPIFYPAGISEDVSAVVWALETSTDPGVIEIAAELVPELQWPVNLKVRPVLERLDDTFRSCIENYSDIRDGMTDRAKACIRTFWLLHMITEEDHQSAKLWTTTYLSPRRDGSPSFQDLHSIQFWTCTPWRLGYYVVPQITPWALRFIAAQKHPENMLKTILTHFNPSNSLLEDESIFADFLFCLNSFFSHTVRQDRTVLAKSEYTTELIALLFEHLVRRLTDSDPLDPKIADDIVIKAAKLVDKFSPTWQDKHRLEPGYRFCALPGVSQEAILSALRLLRLKFDDLSSSGFEKDILQIPCDTTWVYRTLESVGGHHPNLISDLWQGLFVLRPIRSKPTAASLRTMLSVLSAGNGNAHRELAYPTCAVLDSADHWFTDSELRGVLRDQSVWSSLGYLANINPFYVILGDKLSRNTDWIEIVTSDLPGWLGQFPTIICTQYGWFNDEHREKFRSVLSRVWGADEIEADGFGVEATHTMVFSVLAEAWNQVHSLDIGEKQLRYHINLLETTVVGALSARILDDTVLTPSQRFKETIVARLGQALAPAGEYLKHQGSNALSIEQDLKDGIVELGDLISRLASVILGDLRTHSQQQADTATELKYWENLMEAWQGDFRALNEKFK